MPTDGFALRAGMIAQCAGEKRFFPLVDHLMRTMLVWRTSNDPLAGLKSQVKQAGMGSAKVDECLADVALRDEIVKAAYEGQSQFGVSATPSFVVNGELEDHLHSLADFQRVLDPLVN